MKRVYGLIGASGFGSEAMPLLREQENIIKESEEDIEFLYIDADRSKTTLNDIKVISEQEFIEIEAENKFYNISISNPHVRFEVHNRLKGQKILPLSVFSKDFYFLDNVKIEEGAIFLPHSICTSNVKIGRFFHCNPKCSIAHDVKIGDFVTLAPGTLVNGNVTIDDFAYIGAGATIKQGISIGKGSIIGMGSVVIRDVEPGTTVAGNPARVINTSN